MLYRGDLFLSLFFSFSLCLSVSLSLCLSVSLSLCLSVSLSLCLSVSLSLCLSVNQSHAVLTQYWGRLSLFWLSVSVVVSDPLKLKRMADEPAVVEAEPYYPPHETYEKKTKRSTKKKPKASRHIELMEWLPTLPQLFAYIGVTQLFLMFWVFVGECADDVAGTWNIVMMWLMVAGSNNLFGLYQYLFKRPNALINNYFYHPVRALPISFQIQYPQINLPERCGKHHLHLYDVPPLHAPCRVCCCKGYIRPCEVPYDRRDHSVLCGGVFR
eukprot:sb/3479491/